jgi:Protein of unknown function (DUF2946)
LALLALVVQMIVSFGHMHADDLGLRAPSGAERTQFTSAATQAPSGPADQDRHKGSDDYCPICASIALLATGHPSPPPMLVLLVPIGRAWRTETLADRPTPPVMRSFQARAPPAA